MQICLKGNLPPHLIFTLLVKKLEVVNKTRLMGLTVQSDLCWDSQVNSMVSKSSRRLHMLSRFKRFGVPVGDLVTVYIGYVRPIVEYACPVWHVSINVHQTQQIERILRKACRIILGSTYTSYTDALALTGLQTLEERQLHLRIQFAKKCTTSKKYVWRFPLNNSSHRMCLCNTRTYQAHKLRTDRYGNSSITYPHMTFR